MILMSHYCVDLLLYSICNSDALFEVVGDNKKKNRMRKVLGVKILLGVRIVILWLPFQRPISALSLSLGVRLRALLS